MRETGVLLFARYRIGSQSAGVGAGADVEFEVAPALGPFAGISAMECGLLTHRS
jgi:hypothetical protein